MTDLIKVKGLKGKQNKKKWNKNIDVTGLLEHLGQQHTQKVRQKFASPLVVETQSDNLRKPLDPNRFKSKGVKLPKPKYDNRIKKQSLVNDGLDDAWGQKKQVNSKYKMPQIPAIIKPSTGHSYNPNQQGIKQIIDNVIDYQAQKPKKTKQIKKKQFKLQQVRIRNKNLRAQQLATRQRRANKQFQHQIQSHKKIMKQIENKTQQIQQKIQQKRQKQQKLDQQAKTGKVRYGKNLGKLQYKYRESIPNVDEIGKKLSHVSVSQDLIKQRFDSIYRRGIFEPRNIKVHANKTKKIKVKTRYQEDQQKQTKDNINFIK